MWKIHPALARIWRLVWAANLLLPGLAFAAGRRWAAFFGLWAFFAAVFVVYGLVAYFFGSAMTDAVALGVWLGFRLLLLAAWAWQAVAAWRAL